jgi:uncharacterized membrane protein
LWDVELMSAVSEPIGLEIVRFNGGSYTGAILFTGWMYIAAACVLWLVRTWKIGELEERAAVAGKATNEVDVVVDGGQNGGGVPAGFERSPFLKRLFVWAKV